jgi:iron complex transport system substrate-binding protein
MNDGGIQMKGFRKYVNIASIIFLLMLGVLTGCGQTNQEVKEEKKETQQAAEEKTSSFPVTIKDDTGKEITIEKKPEKVVSLLPSSTEILFALGLDKEIVGVSDYDNYPKQALQKEKVGAQDLNVEKILALKPDVAFLDEYHSTNASDTIKQFESAGIKVVIVGSKSSFDQVYETIDMLAKATGTTEKAEEIIAGMKKKVEDIKKKAQNVTEKKRVWVEVSPQPDIFTTGKGTFMQEMLDMIGAENVAADQQGWVKMDEEEIVKRNPEVIITTYGYYVDHPKEQVLNRAGWKEVEAVKNGQVFDVNSDMVTRPGPRLADGVEELGKFIYPDIFK